MSPNLFAPRAGLSAAAVRRALYTGPLPGTWTPVVLSVLRIVTAFLFIVHGTQKLFALPGAPPGMPVALGSLAGAAGVLELVGGALLLLGLFTRPVAFVLAGEMAAAYSLVHAPRDFWPILNGGELAALYCFLFLFLAVAGGGSWSLDESGRRGRRWA